MQVCAGFGQVGEGLGDLWVARLRGETLPSTRSPDPIWQAFLQLLCVHRTGSLGKRGSAAAYHFCNSIMVVMDQAAW